MAAVTVVVFAIFLALSIRGPFSGVSAVGAERVLSGEIPYRDFWGIHAPGQFYLLAALFAVFGHDASVSIIAGALQCAIAVGLCFRLMWKLTGHWAYATACSAVFMAAFLTQGYYDSVSSYSGAIFFLLIAFNILQLYLDRRHVACLIAAGLATGAGALFKHDLGAYAAVSILAGLTAVHLVEGGRAKFRLVMRDGLIYGLAAAAPVLPVATILALVAGQDVFQFLIVFPATIYKYARPETYPSLLPVGLHDAWMVNILLNWSRYLYFALPVATWFLGVPALVAAIRARDGRLIGFGVVFAAMFLFHQSAARIQINTHIISMTLYAICLGSLALHSLSLYRRAAWVSWTRGLASLVVAAWFAALVAKPAYDRIGEDLIKGRESVTAEVSLPKVTWMRTRPDVAANLRGLVSFVQARVPPGQPIYVGQHRHDMVVIGWPYLYFILDRPPATRYDFLEPAVVDTAPVQAEMIRDLREKDVRLIVLVKVFEDEGLDKKKALKSRNLPQIGATILDRFIQSNYEPVRQFGDYTVWLKKATS